MIQEEGFGQKVDQLWQWFVKNQSQLKSAIENGTDTIKIVQSLDDLVLSFGAFSWDLGLDDKDEWFFTISPNLDADRLQISQAIIGEAPTFLNWKFFHAKQSKNWNKKVSMYNADFNEIELDIRDWNYIAYQSSEDTLELEIEVGNYADADKDQLLEAAHTALLNELGEELKITVISKITICAVFSDEDQQDKDSILALKQHALDFIEA